MLVRSLPLLLLLLTLGCEPQGAQGPNQNAGGKEARVIPLKSIYATPDQGELQRLDRRLDKPLGKELHLIDQHFSSGVPAILLVGGEDIGEAVRATRHALCGGHNADSPVPANPGSKPKQLWLVVYFGSWSSAPKWLVRSVAVEQSTIRLKFSLAQNLDPEPVSRLHLVWAPVGQLTAGVYSLELFDEDRKHVALLRRVTVAAE